MAKTTIAINGRLYDGRSGELLGKAPVSAANKHSNSTGGTAKSVSLSDARSHGRSVDGFRHSAGTTSMKTAASTPKRPGLAKVTPAKTRKLQHSQTLMRKTVKKPHVAMKPAIKTQAASEVAAAPKSAVAVPALKKSVQRLDKQRLQRATAVQQSQQIKRFTKAPVQPNMSLVPANAMATTNQSSVSMAQTASVASITQALPARGHYAQQVVPRSSSTAAPAASRAKANHESIFEAAVANARSHEQTQPRQQPKMNHRLLRIGIGVAILLVMLGLAIYGNLTRIELRVASMQAGFHAQLPGYQPLGYKLHGGIHTANGIVSFSFNSGDSNYNIQQQSSNWDSQTLLDNVVALATTNHQTYTAGGRTIFVYNHKATWLSSGILYSLQVSGDLSNQQIVNIASST